MDKTVKIKIQNTQLWSSILMSLSFISLLGCDNQLRFSALDQNRFSTPEGPAITDPYPGVEPTPNPEPPVPPVTVEPTPITEPTPPVVVEPPPVVPPPVVVEPTPIETPAPPVVVDPPIVIDPPIVVQPPTPMPPPAPVYESTSGKCADDSSTSVTSCMKCVVPMNPPAPAPLSTKAQELLQSLKKGCAYQASILGYKAPSDKTLEDMVNRCSALLYPNSAKNNMQSNVIGGLMTGDRNMLNKIFGNSLYYRPPFSTAFETYFGLSNDDAQTLFCRQQGALRIRPVHSKEWYDAQFGENWSNFVETPEYRQALVFGQQLENCLRASYNSPYVPPEPLPAKTCQYETLKGQNGAKITDKVQDWMSKGQKVGIESSQQGVCMSVSSIEQVKSLQGDLTVGTYWCQ